MTTKRIAIIGPESTGKTRLAEELGAFYGTAVVPEIAREWIPNLGRPYRQDDLLELCHLQGKAEDNLLSNNPPILICDTNLTVIRIWSLFKYGSVDPFIVASDLSRSYELILLTDIDLPWVADPLRENPGERKELFTLYYRTLISSGMNFRVIFGKGEQRIRRAISEVNRFIGPSVEK